MTTKAVLSLLCVAWIILPAFARAADEPALVGVSPATGPTTQPVDQRHDPRDEKPAPKESASSDPLTDGGVIFVAVAPRLWTAPPPGLTTPIVLTIEVTNTTGHTMQLNVFDTIDLILKDAQGVEVPYTIHRLRSFIPNPIVIKDKETREVRYNATLKWTADNTALTLALPDGAGGTGHFEPLRPGPYTLHFAIQNNLERLQSVLSRPAKPNDQTAGLPFWMGKITMGDIPFHVAETPIKP